MTTTESWEHTRRLATYLEMANMGPGEYKRALEHRIPKNLAYQTPDGKLVKARELLQSEELATSGLIQTEVLATVVEGSEPAKCMRNVLPVYQMPTNIMTVPYGETGTYAQVVAEGAEIPISTQTLGVMTLTAQKYAIRPMITREMVADSQFDVVATEIRKAGYKVENALNQAALSDILEYSGTAADAGAAGTAAAAYGATAQAVGGLIGLGFTPTDIVLHPVGYGALMSYISTLNTDSAAKVLSGGMESLFGCRVHVCGVTDTSSTYTWGYGTNDYIFGLVVDKNSAGAIGMREDLSVERFEDPIRDLIGMVIKARFDTTYLIANATYRLQY
ncbi:MAG TPA: phage major capsid protein [Methanoregulaceae archaeon]|nr:phage major capsid protein [Methanoregulaceae archaeon]